MTDHELNAVAGEVFAYLDRCEAADERNAQLKNWAWSVLCWDGILPVAVITIPNLLKAILPDWKESLSLIAILLPVIAMGYRFIVGWTRMREGKSYVWQLVVFTLSISALFLFEAFLLNDEVAGGPKIAHIEVLIVMLIVYLSMMAVALFPFRYIAD